MNPTLLPTATLLALSSTLLGAQAGPPPAAPPVASFSRFERPVLVPSTGQACALLDAAVYPHAEPFLRDLRLYGASSPSGPFEIPYVLTLSEPQSVDTESAHLLNLALHGKDIVFDLAMPHRPYTDVNLDLDAHNFFATATVTAFPTAGNPARTSVGSFTLFDLSARHLSRSTTLHLGETDAPVLHVDLTLSAVPGAPALHFTPGIVRGADVPPSREAQTLFTPSARSTDITQRGRETVATFHLPERVPVERVSIVLAPDFTGNFSRDVHVTATTTESDPKASSQSQPDIRELISGSIHRVHLTETGRDIREAQLSIPAVLGANLQDPATVEVAVDNGDNPPLPIAAILLEMRQRKLCFDARSTAGITLFYGDPGLPAPQYDARLLTPSAPSVVAQLGPEAVTPSFRPRPDTRLATERHPDLLWVALLLAVGALGILALRSSRHPVR